MILLSKVSEKKMSREPWLHFTSVVLPSCKLYTNEMSGKSKELSTETKELIIKLNRKKKRRSYISDLLDIPWSTIDSVVKKYLSTGTVKNQLRKGRWKLLTARDEVGLNCLVKKNRLAPLHEITTIFNDNKQHSFSSRTIRRELASEGYKWRAAKRKKRVAWCRERRNWTVDSQWRRYIYSDESQIVVGSNNRIYVWRKGDEVNRPDLVCRPSQRKVSVMIWGVFIF